MLQLSDAEKVSLSRIKVTVRSVSAGIRIRPKKHVVPDGCGLKDEPERLVLIHEPELVEAVALHRLGQAADVEPACRRRRGGGELLLLSHHGGSGIHSRRVDGGREQRRVPYAGQGQWFRQPPGQ